MENLSLSGTYSSICNQQCLLECLKCHKCKRFIHADCSNFPIYSIVNFLNARCRYTCEECARKQLGDDCDRLFAQVYNVIGKERETKQKQRLEHGSAKNDVDETNELDSEHKLAEEKK